MILFGLMDSIENRKRLTSTCGRGCGSSRRPQKLRETIHTVAPTAEECISYGIPAFRLNGRSLVFFGAWANHCAFYPGSSNTLKKFRNELRNFQTSKGTLRFSPDKPMPVALVKKLLKARIAENNAGANRNRKDP